MGLDGRMDSSGLISGEGEINDIDLDCENKKFGFVDGLEIDERIDDGSRL